MTPCAATKDFPHETLRRETVEHTCSLPKGHDGKHKCEGYTEFGDFGRYTIPCGRTWK